MANAVLWGFHNLASAFSERVTNVNVATVDAAIEATRAEHDRQLNALFDLFVSRGTEYSTRFRTVGSAGRLQPLDENGRARPRRMLGYYDVAFPLQMAGDAWGLNYLAMQSITVGDVNRILSGLLIADARWVRDHILAAIYADSDWTWVDDENGTLTVKPIANGDAQTYTLLTGAESGATSDHILAQAAAIADANDPFQTIRDTLMQHPENSGDVIALIPTNLVAAVKGLAGFFSFNDPNVRQGISAATLTGGGPGVAVPGELIGYHEAKVWIVEWRALPDNYILAVTTGGERPIRMREHVNESLRGFRQVAERNDHPWYERQWLRMAGFGAWNRAGALVMRIGNGTYAIPTGYSNPMS